LDNPRYRADVFWAGANSSWNRDFATGRLWASALVNVNFGNIDTIAPNGSSARRVDIMGATLHGSLSYTYGQTSGDRVGVEALYTTGDKNGASDGKYTGVVTGNTWGSPVGIYSSHRAFLLFPDAQVVNRYYSAVHDISNIGYGTTAGFLNYFNNLVPNKWQWKVGLAAALSNEAPMGGGSFIGAEVNTELRYTYKVFLEFAFSAAHMWAGDFYDSGYVRNSMAKPANPWVAFVSMAWLMF
jgi:hypothetical protein